MGLPSILLDSPRATTWKELLEQHGMVVEIDHAQMSPDARGAARPETPYVIRSGEDWIPALLSYRPSDNCPFLVFFPYIKGSSPPLMDRVIGIIERAREDG